MDVGEKLYQLLEELFPILRSITGNGVRQTLKILQEHVPIEIHEVPSGTKVFDWTVPEEWNISEAYIKDEDGNLILDIQQNNLHVVSYSIPVDKWVSLSDLQEHLHSLPDQPNAIPYVTSYYKKCWGFCITHNAREKLKDKKYHVVINSELKEGCLTYGECIIPGKEANKEIFISSYICHPSMANNELSGPVVAASIGKWLRTAPRRYTYRIIFIPETIGSITYLSKNLKGLKQKVVAGFNLSCIGDERAYSYVASRYENTLADQVASNVLSSITKDFIKYSFLDRGSDERQYGSPGVDLPLVTLSKSKFHTYPEYHTSLDNLDFITPQGLQDGYDYVKQCILALEHNHTYRTTCLAEPQLGKRGLYPSIATKHSGTMVETLMDFLAYADGSNTLIEISNIIGKSVGDLIPIAEKLTNLGLVEVIE
jgi:aminopeptidase-like protein